jgi:hypothetical protein
MDDLGRSDLLPMIMHRHRIALFSLLALLCASLLFVSSARDDVNKEREAIAPFATTEELVYDGKLSKALLRGVNVAEIRFQAERQGSSNGAVRTDNPIKLKAEIVSKGILLKLFGVNFRQRQDSMVEPLSLSLISNTRVYEQGSRKRESHTTLDTSSRTITWTERDPNDPGREPRVVKTELIGAVHDLVSAVYFLRVHSIEPGKNFEINVSDSGRIVRVPVSVGERKRFKTILGDVVAVRLVPEVFGEGRLLQGKGSISIWITDDQRHVPIRAQINTELGKLDITLKKLNDPFGKAF